MELPDFLNIKMFQLIVLINIITNYYTFAVIDDDIQDLKGVQGFPEPKKLDNDIQTFNGMKDFSEPQNSGESKDFMGIPGFSQAINQYLQSMTRGSSEDLYRSSTGFGEEQNNNNLIKILFGGLIKDQTSSHVIDYDGGEIHISNNEVMLNDGRTTKEQTFDLVFPSKRIIHSTITKDETENTLKKFFGLSSKIGSNLNSDQSNSKPDNISLESDSFQMDGNSDINDDRKMKAQYRKKRSLFGDAFQTAGTALDEILENLEHDSQTILGGQPAGGAAGGAAGAGAGGAGAAPAAPAAAAGK